MVKKEKRKKKKTRTARQKINYHEDVNSFIIDPRSHSKTIKGIVSKGLGF